MFEDERQIAVVAAATQPAVTVTRATRASSDDELVASWLAGLASPRTRRNFGATAKRFLTALGMSLRTATVEDIRDALGTLTSGVSASTGRQYVQRVRSLIGYGHRLGFLTFNAAAVIKVGTAPSQLAQRILSEVEVGLLLRSASTGRDRTLLAVAYAGGLRVSELVALTWADVIARDGGRVQLSVLGKGSKRREVLLPSTVGSAVLAIRNGATDDMPVFRSRRCTAGRRGTHPNALSTRAVNQMIKAVARRAGVNERTSAHWLRHCHASHALDRGASLATVRDTLGHASIAVTSTYLHARPSDGSGLHLDEGVFRCEPTR